MKPYPIALAAALVMALVLGVAGCGAWENMTWDGRYGTINRWEYDQRKVGCQNHPEGTPGWETCMTLSEPD